MEVTLSLNIMQMLDEIDQETLVPEDLREQGWIYKDFPGRFSLEAWDMLIGIIGKGNYKLVAFSEGRSPEGDFKRGQFLLSPQAQQNLWAYAWQEQQ